MLDHLTLSLDTERQRSDAIGRQLDYLVEIVHARHNIDIRVLPADGRELYVAGSFELLTKPNESVPFMAITFDETGATYHEGVKLDHRRCAPHSP